MTQPNSNPNRWQKFLQSLKKRERATAPVRPSRQHVEVLESRIAPALSTLTTTLIGGHLTVDDAGDASHNLSITISGANIVINDPVEEFDGAPVGGSLSGDFHTLTIPLASVTSGLVFNGGAGNDTLTINFSGGTQFVAGGIVFNGGGQVSPTNGDTLVITGGTTSTVTHNFINEHDGSVTLTGALAGTITYTGLEPILDNLSATDRVFTFLGGAETIGVFDDAGATMRIKSSLAESVSFVYPTTSITINAGLGSDIINFNSIDPFYAGSFVVNGDDGNDTLTLNLGTGGDLIPAGGFTFNGGAPAAPSVGDALVISGGSQGAVTYNYTSPSDGGIVMSVYGTVLYTGLEPITNTGSATDVVMNLPVGFVSISSLGDDGTAGNGLSKLTSLSGTFESTVFANPTNSLTINRGDSGDSLVLNALPDFNASLSVGSGASPFSSISLAGALTLAANKGVSFDATTISFSNTTADLVLSGTGAATLTAKKTISMANGSSISVVDGDVTLAANVGNTGTGDFAGITLNGATIGSTGSGNISVTGKGGGTAGNLYGVSLSNASAISSTGTGSVTVTGTASASATGGGNSGVAVLSGSDIIGGTSGTTVVTGFGGGGTSTFINGVFVSDAGSSITSGGANVSVTGTGGSTTASVAVGVEVYSGGLITAGGSGSVTVLGTGGTGALSHGVDVSAGGTITSSNGTVSVTGIGAGGGTTSDTYGVSVYNTGTITSGGANTVSVTGTGGTGSGGNNYGVFVQVGGSKIASGGGSLTVTGTGGAGSGNEGIALTSVGSITTAATGGSISLISDKMNLAGPVSGTGSLTIRPINASAAIGVGTGATGTLLLDNSELANLVDGFSSVTFGAVSARPDIDVVGATLTDVVNFIGNNVTIASLNTGANNVNVNGTSVSPVGSGVDVTAGTLAFTSGSSLSIPVNGTTPDTLYRQLNVAGSVDLTGLSLSISGSYTPTTGESFIIVNNDGTDAVTGTFNGLPEGSIVSVNGVNKRLTYTGGTGNDVALLVNGTTDVALSGGNLVITDNFGGNTNDTLTIMLNGANVRISDPSNLLFAGSGATQVDGNTIDVPLANITAGITVNTMGGDDVLTVNFSGGNVIPAGGLNYSGGAGGNDSLVVTGGTTTTVTHSFTNANDGSVTLTGALAGTINYTGLEPITDNLSVTDRVFTFTGGAETVTLVDGVGTTMTIDSTLSESVTFANPTNSLTVNLTSGADALTVNSMDAAYAGSLTITSDGGDTATISAGLPTLSALSVTAATINLNTVTTTGAQSYTGPVKLLANTTLTTTNSNVTFTSTLDADAAASNRTLSIGVGTGAVSFGTAVGGLQALQSLTVSSAASALLGAVTTRSGGLSVTASAITLTGNIATDNGGTAGTVSFTGPVTLGANVAFDTDGSTDASVTFSTTVNSDATPRTLSITSGGGNVTFTGVVGGTNALQGLTVVSSNNLSLGNVTTRDGGISLTSSNNNLLSGALVTTTGGTAGAVSISGATRLMGNVSINTNATTTDAGITITGTVNAEAGVTTRTLALDAGTGSISATGNVGVTDKLLAYTITSAASANIGRIETRSGGVSVTAGAITLNGNITTTTGGTAGPATFNGAVTLGANVTVNTDTTSDGAISFSSTINGAQSLTLTGGAGNVTLSGAVGGTTPLTGVTVTAGDFNATSIALAASSALSITNTGTASTITGAITGTSATLTKAGAGRLTLADSTSTFSGNVDVQGGFLRASAGHLNTNNTSAFGLPISAGRTITVGSGATLEFSVNDVFGNAVASPTVSIIANGGTITNTGNFFNTLGPVTLNAGTLNAVGGVVGNYQAWRLFGTVTVGGAAASTISGSGANSGIHLHSSTTFDVADATGNSNPDLIISGVLINQTGDQASAAGALVKSGSGTMNLTGANTYTGATAVNAGTLRVNGSVTSNVTVTSPGTLGGSGTITGNVSGNGTVAPGNSPGILTISGNFTPTGTLAFEVNQPYNTAGTDYDQIVVGGTVDLSGATLSIAGGTAAASALQMVTLINKTSGGATVASTSPAEGATVTLGSASFKIFYNGGDGNNVVLVDASTPTVVYAEDTAWSALTAGTVIADADFGTAGNQPAIFGVNAFSTIGAGITAVTASGQIVVNDGLYSEAVSLNGTKTLTVTTGAAVTLNSFTSIAGTTATISGTSLTIGDATSTTVAGVINGAGGLVKNGSGTLTLEGANSYGGSTLNAGTLQIGSGGTAGTPGTGSIAISGGTLSLNRSDSPTFTNAINLVNGGNRFISVATGTTATLSGQVTASGGGTAAELWKSGNGTLVLSNATNSHTGSNVIQAGTLEIGDFAALGGGNLFIGQGGSGTIRYTGGSTSTSKIGAAALQGTGANSTIEVTNAASTLSLTAALGNTASGKGYTKSGAGTLAVTVDVTQDGPVTISAGSLIVGNGATAGSLTASGTAAVTNNGTLTVNRSDTFSINNAISGSGNVIQAGSGTLVLTGTNSYSGGTAVNAGTLQLGNGGTAGDAGTGSISLTGALSLNRSDSPTFANTINLVNGGNRFISVATGTTATLSGQVTASGGGAAAELWKSGNGNLVLSNATNSHTGSNVIQAGTLEIADFAALGGGNLFIGQGGSGTIKYTGASASTTKITAFALQGTGTNSTIEVTNSATTLTLAAAVGNNGAGKGFTKTGAGSLQLDGANTFDGATVISAGTVIGNNSTAFGTGGIVLNDASTGASNTSVLLANSVDITNPVTVANLGTGVSTIGTSGAGLAANATTFGGLITLNKATTFSGTATDRLAIDGQVTGSVGTLTVSGGSRTTLLSTANNFVGNILITGAGTILQASVATAGEVIPNATNVDVGVGAIFQLAGSAGSTETINSLTGSGTITRNVAGTQTLAIGSANGGGTFAGVITNGSGVIALTKLGAGTQTISGTASSTNTASGLLQVSGGTLIMGGAFAGDGAWQGDVTINNTATLQLAQGDIFNNGSDWTINTGGTFNMNSFTDTIGNIAGGGAITNNSGAGLLLDDINGTKTFTGTINGTGSLTLRGNVAATGTQEFKPLTATTSTLSSLVVQRGTLLLGGAGTITASGNLSVGQVGATGGNLTIQDTVTVGVTGEFLIGDASTIPGFVTQTGGTVNIGNRVRLGHWPSPTTSTYAMSGGSLTVANALNVGWDANATFTQTGGTVSATQLVIDANGVTAGVEAYSLQGGTLNIGTGGITSVDGAAGYALNLGGGTAPVLRATGNFTSALNATLSGSGANAITVDTNGFTVGLSGVLGGTGALTKIGANVLTISGANTYSGATAINVGTLTAGSGAALGTAVGATTVASGATLNINGQNLGAEIVNIAGTGVGGLGALVNNGAAQTQALRFINLTADATVGGTGRFDIRTNGGGEQLDLAGFTLTKVGANQFSIVGANVTNGNLTANAGILAIETSSNVAGTGTITINAATLGLWNNTGTFTRPIVLNSGASINEQGSNALATVSSPITLNANASINVGSAATTLLLNGVITDGAGTFGFTQTGAGTLVLAGANTYDGTTTVSAGTLQIGNNGTSGTVGTGPVVNNSNLHFKRTDATSFGNTVTGTGTTRQLDGSGQVTITGSVTQANVYAGSGSTAIIAAANPLVLSGTSVLNVSGIFGGTTADAGMGLFGKAVIQAGATLNTANLWLGEQTGRTGEVQQDGGAVTVSQQMRVGHWPSNTSTYTINGGTLSLTGTPAGGTEQNGILYVGIDGTGIFNQTGGTVTASGMVLDNRGDTAGTDTYTMTGGTLVLGSFGISGNASTQVNLQGGTVRASASFTAALPVTFTGGSTTLDTNGFAITLSNALSGSGNFNKINGGTLNISGTSAAYAGTGSMSAGTTNLSGSLGTSATFAVNGGTLIGTGTIAGTLNVNTGGTVNPGTVGSVGTLNTGTLNFNGGTYAADLVGTGADKITATTAVNVNGGTAGVFSLNNAAGSVAANTVFTFIENNAATAIANPPLSGASEGGVVTVDSKTARYTYLGGLGGNDFTLTVDGSLTITGTAGADNFEVRRVVTGPADDIQVLLGGVIIDSRPTASYGGGSTLTINAGANNDNLFINYGGSGGIYNFDVNFNGEGQASVPGDTITIGGASVTTVTHNFINNNDGNIVVLDGSGTRTVNYTGLEPIVDNLDAVNRVFAFSGATETISLTSVAAGISNIDSNVGGETVTFVNPTTSLSIDGGAGDDTINITSMGSGYTGSITVDGSTNTDSITISTGLPIFSTATFTAETINAATLTTSGNQNYTGAVLLSGATTLTSNTGSLIITGTVNGAQALALTAATGNINATSAIGGVTPLTSLTTSSATISALPAITAGALTITATAGGVSGANNVVISGATSVTAAGAITLNGAANDFQGSVTLSSTAAGAITVTDSTGGLSVASATTTDGAISLTATSGNLAVTSATAGGAGRNVTLTTVTSGNVLVDNVAAAGDTITINSVGAIEESGADAGADLTASTLSLTAASGIGAAGTVETAANSLNGTTATGGIALANTGALNVTGLSVTTSGDISLSNIGGLTTSGVVSTASGAVTVSGTTLVTLGANVSATGAILITAGENSDSPTFADDVTLNAAVSVTSSAASVTLQAGDDIITNAGSLISAATTATLTAAFGDLDGSGGIQHGGTITAAGNVIGSARTNIALGGNITSTGANATLTSTNGNITRSAGTVSAGTVTLSAANGSIGTIGAQVSTSAAALVTTSSGDQFITEADGATVTGSATTGNINLTTTLGDWTLVSTGLTTTGNVNMTASAGDILRSAGTVGGNVLTFTAGGADGDIGLVGAAIQTAGTTINFTGAATGEVAITESNGATVSGTTGSGDINLVSTTGDWTIGGNVTTTGNVNMTASAGDILRSAGTVGGNALTFTAGGADGDIGVVGAAIQTAGTTINFTGAGTGEVAITESNGATVSGTTGSGDINLVSPTGNWNVNAIATTGNVFLTASAGAITDANGAAVNITSGGFVAVASTGIGAGNPLETSVTSLEAQTATGGIFIMETDAVNIGGVSGVIGVSTTTSGDIDISAGTINVNEVISGAANVTLTTVDVFDSPALIHDINVSANISAVGLLTIRAGDDLLTNPGTTLSAGVLTLIAPYNDSGDGGSMTLNGNISVAGNILISVPDVNDSPTFGQDLTIGGVLQSTGGSVTLQAGDELTVNPGGQVLAATTVTLTAAFADLDNHGFATLNGLTSGGGLVTVSARDTISLGGNVTSTGSNVSMTSTAGNILHTAGTASGSLVTLSAPTGIGAAGVGSAVQTAATTINFNTTTGSVFITENNGASVSGSSTSGNINLVSTTGDWTLISTGVDTAGDVSITASAGDILRSGAAADITGNVLTLTAGGTDGDLGTSLNDLLTTGSAIVFAGAGTGEVFITETNGATVTGSTGSGTITLTTDAGDWTVVSSGVDTAGNVNFTANAGDILRSGGAADITGATLSLNAGGADGDLGAAGTPLLTAGSLLFFTGSGTGDVVITEADGASVTGSTSTGVVTLITTTGNWTVIPTGVSTSGNVNMTASAGDIVRGGGLFETIAGNVLTLTAGGADGDLGAAGTPLLTVGTAIVFAGAGTGDVFITESNGATVTGSTGSGNATLITNTGNWTVVGPGVSTTGNVTMTASAGDLLRTAFDPTAIVAGNIVTLTAGGPNGDIGLNALPQNRFLTNATSIVFTGTGTGSVSIIESNGATVTGSTGSGTINLTTSTGDWTVVGSGLTTTGNESLFAFAGDILRSGAGAVISGASLTLFTSGADGDIGTSVDPLLTTVASITFTGSGTGDVFITETNGATVSGTTGSGDINLVSTTGDWTLVGDVTTTGNVIITAGNDIIRTAGTVGGNVLTFTAGGADGDIGASGAAIQTTGSAIVFAGTGTGDVFITETDGATVTGSTGSGNVTLISTTGDWTVVNPGISTTGNVTMTAQAGDLLRSGANAFVAGNLLTLTAGGADGGIGSPASAFLTTGTTIVFTATGTGNVDLSESDSAFISGVSGAGNTEVNLVAGVDWNLNLLALSAVSSVANIVAAGAVLDNNGPANNLTALAAIITGGSGVGTPANFIETAISNLEADGGNGGVFIAETDALTIGGISAMDGVSSLTGDIAITSGALTITETIATPGEASLTSTSTITETGAGKVEAEDFITSSVGEQTLLGDNVVKTFTALNTGAGTGISLQNTKDNFEIMAVTNQTGGNVFINNDGNGAEIVGVIASGTPALGGDIFVQTDGLMTVNSVVNSSGGTGGTLTLGGLLILNTSPVVGFGDITLQGGPGPLTINAPILVASPLILQSVEDVNILAKVETTSLLADITVLADMDNNGTGGVYIGDNLFDGSLKSGRNLDVRGSEYLGSFVPALAGLNNSVMIDPNGSSARLEAVGNVFLKNNTAASADAQIWLGGLVRSNTSGDVSFDNAVLITSNDARALTHAGGDVIFLSTVNSDAAGAFDLRVSTDTGVVLFNGAVGQTNPLGDVTIDTALDVTVVAAFDAASLTAGNILGTVDFGGPVTLTADGLNLSINALTLLVNAPLDFTATGTTGNALLQVDNIEISSTVAGNGVLTIQPQDVTRSIGINEAGSLNLSGAEIGQLQNGFSQIIIGRANGTGLITIGERAGAESWLDPVLFRSQGAGGEIDILGQLAGTDDGGFTFLAPKTIVNVAGVPTISTAGGDVRFGLLNNGTGVLLRTDLTIETAGGDVVSYGTINGAFDLVVSAGAGSVGFWGNPTPVQSGTSIGGDAALTSLTATGGVLTLFCNIRTTGDQVYTGTDIQMANGSRTSLAGSLVFNGPVTVTQSLRNFAANDIIFNGDVNSEPLGTGALTLTADNVTFTMSVGNVTPLRFLTVAATGSLSIGGAGETFNAGALTLEADEVALEGTVLVPGGAISIKANEVDFIGTVSAIGGTLQIDVRDSATTAMRIGGAEGDLVAGAPTLNFSDTDIAALADGFNSISFSRIAGTQPIVVAEAGPVTFLDPVSIQQSIKGGQVQILGDLTVAGNFTAKGSATVIDGNITTTGGGNIDITTGIVAGNVTLDSSAGGGDVFLRGNWAASVASADLTVDAGAGDISIAARLGNNFGKGTLFGTMQFTSTGTVAFGTALTAESLSVLGNGIAKLGGTIVTTGAGGQFYDATVQLAKATSITSRHALGVVEFNSTVDSIAPKYNSLTVTNRAAAATTDAVLFDSAIGSSQRVGTVRVNTSGTALFGGAITAKAVSIRASEFTVQDVDTSFVDTVTNSQVYSGIGQFLGAITTERLTITSTAAITNTQPWLVSGLATLNAGRFADVNVTNIPAATENHFNELIVRGSTASVEAEGDINFRTSRVIGNFSVNTDGNITQTGGITAGTLIAATAGSITLADTRNRIDGFSNVTAGGTLSLVSGHAPTVLLDGTISSGTGNMLLAATRGSFIYSTLLTAITAAGGNWTMYTTYLNYPSYDLESQFAPDAVEEGAYPIAPIAGGNVIVYKLIHD